MSFESMYDYEVSQDEALEMRRAVLARRGRWMVVHEDGSCWRMNSMAMAIGVVWQYRELVGERVRVLRYRRDRVRYVHGSLAVANDRWLP